MAAQEIVIPDASVVRASVKALEDMQLVVHRLGHRLAEESIEKAYRIGVAIYDAAYVALAEMRGGTLYTADAELVSKADSEHVRHLSEYQGPQ